MFNKVGSLNAFQTNASESNRMETLEALVSPGAFVIYKRVQEAPWLTKERKSMEDSWMLNLFFLDFKICFWTSTWQQNWLISENLFQNCQWWFTNDDLLGILFL